MRFKSVFTFVFTAFALCASCGVFARAEAPIYKVPEKPTTNYVFDENRLLSAQQFKYFDQLSNELYGKTGIRLAVALMDDIGEINVNGYSAQLAGKWGIGSEGDSGILIFVALKQRRRSVEIGSEIANVVPDTDINRLQQEFLIPAFRKEKYGEGILQMSYSLAQAICKQKGVSLDVAPANIPGEEPMTVRGWIFIVAVAAFLALSAKNGKRLTIKSKHINVQSRLWCSFGQKEPGKLGDGRW